MTLKEYGEYIILNINRASLLNTLNITDAINKNNYDICELADSIMELSISSFQNGFISNPLIMYTVCLLSSKCKTSILKSNNLLYRQMCIDDYIIGIWEAFQV